MTVSPGQQTATRPSGNPRLNALLIRSIVVGALGGLLFGFDTAVIAGTTQQLSQVFHLTPKELGFTVSIALLGTIIGAMFSGILGDRLGGRESLRILAGFYIISALGCAFAWNWPSLLIFRFIGGLGIGGSSVLGPVYIAEIAPARWRGLLVGSFQINIVIGILVAYLSNYLIELGSFGMNEWRWQLGIAAAPAILFLIMLFGIPRSARWLVTQYRIPEARQVLEKLGSDNPQGELDEIVASVHVEDAPHSEPLFQRKYWLPIYLAFTVAAFNQLAGINAILYYLNYIFAMAGFSKVSGDLQAVAVGAMNLVATLLGMSLIDKLGRKTLLTDRRRGNDILPDRCSCNLLQPSAPGSAGVVPCRLYRVLRDFRGRGHLGVHQRSVSQPRPFERAEPGQFDPLDHELHHLARLSLFCGPFRWRLSLCILRRHDGADVFRRALHLSRDQGRYAGADAAQTGD